MDAVVGEYRVGAGHVDGGCVVRAERDGRCTSCVSDAGGASQGRDVIEADHLSQGDGGVVERVSERVNSGDVAVVLVFVIARAVGLAAVVVGEGRWRVVELRDRGEDTAFAE